MLIRHRLSCSEQIGNNGSVSLQSGSFGFSLMGLTETTGRFTNSGGTFLTGGNSGGSALGGGGAVFMGSELVPVPEPGPIAATAVLALVILRRESRRSRRQGT